MMGADECAVIPPVQVQVQVQAQAGAGHPRRRDGSAAIEAGEIWRRSAALEGGRGLGAHLRRARFCTHALRHRQATQTLLQGGGLLGRMLAERPHLVGLITAPYLCAAWSPAERIRHFTDHVRRLEQLGPGFAFGTSDSVELSPLEALGPGFHLVLDKPDWFHREGVLALNLFQDNLRLFTIAFALAEHEARLTTIIGGIQGRNLPGILDRYRDLTRLAHGLRPRDLLLEALRSLCRALGVTEILAVSDASRHHRSPYFGPDTGRELPLDYDAIWADRGGTPRDRDFYALPLAQPARALADIPAKKRGMYRRRQDFLAALEPAIRDGLRSAQPVRRVQAE